MKKIKVLCILGLSLLALAACGNKNEVKLDDVSEIRINDIKITPKEAEVKDDTLTVTLDWIRGTNEDSMKKESFMSSGILFYAQQGDTWLKDDLKNSQGLYEEAYEASTRTLHIKFNLENKKDNVKFIAKKQGYTSAEESFVIKLPQ